MGLISGNNAGKEIFNSKFITAIIDDNADRRYFVQIKNTIGDFFLTEIGKQIYCFKLAGKVKTHRATFTKSFRSVNYDINHYMPISAGDIQALENLLNDNGLPKVTNRMFSVLKYFSNREKKNGTSEHSIEELLTEMKDKQKGYEQQVESMENYLKTLDTKKIVGPTRKVVEFLDSDFLATDPKFFGTVMTTHLILEGDHKKITNYPVSSKKPWLKIILIVALIGLLIGIIFVFAQGGAFNNILPSFPIPGQPQGQSYNDADLMKQFSSPEAMKDAIAHGQIDYTKLSANMKKMVDTAKTPVATPAPPIPSSQH